MKKFLFIFVLLVAALITTQAQTQYVNVLGAATGWYSDDTRSTTGADLVGITRTLYGKPGQTPTAADDITIDQQLQFVAGPAGGLYGGAIKIDGTSSNSGKSTISTVNLSGFAPSSDLVGGSFTASYKWYLEPNPTSRTVAFRIGIQSTQWAASQAGFTAIRSGEQTWDLKLVNVMSSPTANAWNDVAVDMNNGLWYLYGQATNANWVGIAGSAPPGGTLQQTLAQWQADATWGPILFGTGAKITSVDFGLGSGQRQCNAYVDYLQTTILNGGNVIDFVAPVHNITQNTFHGTIQLAIDAAISGDVIQVPSGTFAGNITINKSLTLLGDPGDASPGPGINAPIIDGGNTNIDAFKITNGISNVTISGFVIQNFSSPSYNTIGSGIQAWVGSTSYITVQDNSFLNLGYNGILVGNDYNSNPAKWGDHTYWTVKRNIVSNCGYIGFELTNTSNSSIEENVFHLNTPYIGAIFSSARRSESGLTIRSNLIDGIPSTTFPVIYVYAYDLDMPNPNLNNLLIESNGIETVGTPAQIYIRNIGTGTVTGVTVKSNKVSTLRTNIPAIIDARNNYWGSANGPIHPKNVFNVGSQSGAVTISTGGSSPIFCPWWKDLSGSPGTYTGTSFAPITNNEAESYSNFTDAISGTNNDGIISAAAGTFTDSIDLQKPLSILGQGSSLSFIDRSATPLAGNVVSIYNLSGNVTLDGFTFKTGPASTFASNGISISNMTGPGTITISNNEIWGVQSATQTAQINYGLIAGYFSVTTPKLVFDNNIVHGGSDNPILIEKWMGPTEITNNTLYQNPLKDFSSSDVIFMMNYGGTTNTAKQLIKGNTFDMGWGTVYNNSTRGTGISIAGSYTGGTSPGGFTNVEISENTFLNLKPSRRGIGLWNNSSDGTGGGIANGVISGNTISNASGFTGEYGIRVLGKATGTQILNNKISGVIDAVKVQPWNGHEANTTTVNYNSLLGATYALNNLTSVLVDASGNWFGSKFSSYFLPMLQGSIDYTPWLHSGSDVSGDPGFQPQLSDLWVDSASPQTGTVGIIQEAVNMVSGSTIYVLAGTYSEILNINKSLNLLGPNSNISPNTGTRVTEAILTGGLNVDNTSSKIVAVKGFKFNGVSSPFSYNGNASGTITADFTFKNNITENSSGQLAIMLGTSLNSAAVIIEDNKFSNMTSNAMQLVAGGGNLSANILKNVINTTVNAGINTDGLTNSTISENTISSTGQQGIQIAGPASNVTVNLNNISNANTTLAADRGAIRLYGSSFTGTVSIYDNILTNSFNGIAIRNGENISGKDIRFYQNKITGNVNKGAYHGGTGMLTAKYNWWGDVTGPYDNKTLPGIPNYNNPGGLGNAVTSYVDYNPWNLAPTYYNTPETAYKLYISSSTAVKDTIIYPNTAWGVTAYEAPPPAAGDDWDFTAPVDFYIVPEANSKFGACDITLEWDNSLYSFAGVSESGGLFDSPHFFNFNTLGGTNRVTINASTSDYSNFNTSSGNYIAKVSLNLLKPGYGPIKFKTMDFRYFDGLNPPLGVYVTGKMATVKSYLGDVAALSPASEATGDGLVEVADLNTWTYSYWSGVPGYGGGMTYYKVKCDVGPTNTGTIFGMPAIDSKIQFEDLVIFAMSYGASANGIYPKIAPPPTEPVEISVGKPLAVGSETLVPLFISGAVQDLRAASLSFSGSFGKLISAEKGDLLNSYTTPIMLMSRTDGNNVFVDLSIVGADVKGLGEQGQLIVLRFEGKANVNITSAELRNTANVPMLSKLINNSKGIPTEFGISQNYPNPFNPSTMISYQVPVAAMVQIAVFNSIGEKVGMLVNEVKEPGYYEVTWNASAMPSGVYFFRINAGEFTAVKKMMLTK